MNEAPHDTVKSAPFDTARLDALLEDEGIDVLVATSKHNVQYVLDGYRCFFFDYMDAIGVSRYLPVVVYHKGTPTTRPISDTRSKGTRSSSASSGLGSNDKNLMCALVSRR
jgi:hypothetical protein